MTKLLLISILMSQAFAMSARKGSPNNSNKVSGVEVMVHLALDKACKQFGYTKNVYNTEYTYADARVKSGASFSQVEAEIAARFEDRSKCGVAPKQVSRFKTLMSNFFGGTFNGPNYLLSPARNLTYYQFKSLKGNPAVTAAFGFNTQRVGIAIPSNGLNQESVQDALNSISQMKDAGYRYAWPVIYLKGDCCSMLPMPPQFGNPTKDTEVYRKVADYSYLTMKELLAKSALPILMVEVGNEMDGGFWTNFDAVNGRYQGPPDRIDRTKKVMKAAKDGIRKAYSELKLDQPFFTLHLMPGTDMGYTANLNLMKSFLSTDHSGEALFDNVMWSFYPSSRDGLNPHQTAEVLKNLGDASGLPWGHAEMGIAQEPAPGRPATKETPWNYFVDYKEWCPKLYNSPCSNYREYQARLMDSTQKIFSKSPLYRGSIYLAPQSNIISNDLGQREGPSDIYRLALWVNAQNVSTTDNSTASMTGAFYSFQYWSDRLSAPVMNDVGHSCSSSTNCFMWIWGANLNPTTRIEIRNLKTGQFLTLIHSDDYQYETPSVISFSVPVTIADVFRQDGLRFVIYNYGSSGQDIPSQPYLKSP